MEELVRVEDDEADDEELYWKSELVREEKWARKEE